MKHYLGVFSRGEAALFYPTLPDRVEGGVAFPLPHRSGRAGFPHPVPRIMDSRLCGKLPAYSADAIGASADLSSPNSICFYRRVD